MAHHNARTARVLLVVLLALCLLAAVRPASAEPGDPAPADPTWPDTLVRDYTAAYPTLTAAQVRDRLDKAERRKRLAMGWAQAHPTTYAGTWYDFSADVVHVATTAGRQRAALQADGSAVGITIATHMVSRSLLDLELTRDRILAGSLVPGVDDGDQVRLDLPTNSVTIGAPADDRRRMAGLRLPAGTRLVPVTKGPVGVPAACRDRLNCGAPLRSGVNIGTFFNRADAGCSVGFTARGTDGSRWALTAGHCVPQNHIDVGRLWGHGEQYIGPARQRYDTGAVDVARIRMDNPYWRQAGGGYMYATPTSTVDVDLAILYRSTIEINDSVCLTGRRYNPGDDNCGRVTRLYNERDLVEISGLKACGGDSGGAAYLLLSGARWGYGLLNSTSLRTAPGDCTPANSKAYFSPLPDINRFFDSRSPTVQVRVETR
jgi:hypothetical protein